MILSATLVLIVIPTTIIILIILAIPFSLLITSSFIVFGYLLVAILYGLYPVIWPDKYYKRGFERVVLEFEFIKKIIIVEIIIITGVLLLERFVPPQWFGYFFTQFTLPHPQVGSTGLAITLLTLLLLSTISSGGIRIGLQNVRREFRFPFASACFAIISRDEDYLKNMRYLALGLSSYNKYINRHLRYRIQDKYFRIFYSKFIRANVEERREIINSLREAFDINRGDDYTQPIKCLSTILKVPETEEFLSRETAIQKIKLVGPVLAAAIPVIISIIDLLNRLKFLAF